MKVYSKRRVVSDVSIEVNAGEVVGLLGPNGAGKTTTFYMIVGMIRPNDGTISRRRQGRDEGADVQAGEDGDRLSLAGAVDIPGDDRGAEPHGDPRDGQDDEGGSGWRGSRRSSKELDISHVRKSMGYQLSGGERRRVEITRALVIEPKFMLLDEPFAGIDPIAVADLQRIVKKLKDRGLGILITDHNVRDTLSITDRSYVMYEGSIKRSGTPDELAGDAEVREIYLGESFQL